MRNYECLKSETFLLVNELTFHSLEEHIAGLIELIGIMYLNQVFDKCN